jgi:hypothetical protein
MADEKDPEPGEIFPANDEDDIAPFRRVGEVAASIARLIGQRLAREEFERLRAENDNSPVRHEGDGAD